MRTSFGILALTALSNLALAQAAPRYAGTWKLNPAKSDFGQITIAYEPVADGGFMVNVAGQSYTLSADGKETPTPWGGTIAGKRVDASTFTTVNRVNGKVGSTDTLRVSADGSTLTVDSKVARASGEIASEQITLRRVGAGNGLAGKWQANAVTSTAPERLTISAEGNALTIRLDSEGECSPKFDEKDVPASGDLWGKGWTCSVARRGDRGFDLSQKREGKLMYRSTFMVSADGKTLIETGGFVGANQTIKFVYDRQ